MRIFDTLTEEKIEVKAPRDNITFRMFICGPTVQDNVHLGHAKTYFAFDVLARWLLKRGFTIFFLMNITDVDDKIFDRAKRENVPYTSIANRFYGEFLEDLEALNIVTVSKFARVSDYVSESAKLVEQMVESGKAYPLNRSVYFDTSKAVQFGKLSHQSEFELKLKVIDASPGKRNPVDFLIWRHATNETEGIWESKVGAGRPGWHVEDSAIAFRELHGPYDLHGGAQELIFPHHEAELAQDEAISGIVPFVSIWMHTGLLLTSGEKMSKSLGNVLTIRDALKTFEADVIRYYFLKKHYRDSYNLDLESLASCTGEFSIIRSAARSIPKSELVSGPSEIGEPDARKKTHFKTWKESKYALDFDRAMDDDFDTAKAIRLLSRLSSEIIGLSKSDPTRIELGHVFWHMVESLGFRML